MTLPDDSNISTYTEGLLLATARNSRHLASKCRSENDNTPDYDTWQASVAPKTENPESYCKCRSENDNTSDYDTWQASVAPKTENPESYCKCRSEN